MGRQVQHVGSRRQRAHQHRQPIRSAARAQGRKVGSAACAISDGLLHQVAGRPHRRREGGLEGAWSLGDHQYARAVPYGRRQGKHEQGIQVPAPAGSAGEVKQLESINFSLKVFMKAAAVIVALFISACAGSTAEPPTEQVIAGDSCAVARPNFGAAATAADRALFAYDVGAPLNLQKTVESTSNGVEVSAISYSSPAGGTVT